MKSKTRSGGVYAAMGAVAEQISRRDAIVNSEFGMRNQWLGELRGIACWCESKARSSGACAATGAVVEQTFRRDAIHGVRPRVSAPLAHMALKRTLLLAYSIGRGRHRHGSGLKPSTLADAHVVRTYAMQAPRMKQPHPFGLRQRMIPQRDR